MGSVVSSKIIMAVVSFFYGLREGKQDGDLLFRLLLRTS
jgi:hypothetical protein